MRISRRAIARLTVLVLACTSALFASVGPALATTPPWEPDPNTAAPYGTVVFYDAAGTVLTSGSDLGHLADYAAATTGPSAGATKATLIFAAPDHTKVTSLWTTGSGSASTVFPNSSAPPPIQGPGFTNPLVTLEPTDANLTAFLGGVTKDTTEGYANIYQVRIKDSGPNGAGSGSRYWASDILVDENAGTWQLIYPQTPTSISLTASPAGSQYEGSSVALSATVTPAVAGSVQFKDGTSDVGGSVAVDGSGLASLSTTDLTVGAHALSAVFTPTDTAAYSGSTSAPMSYSIIGPPSWKPVLDGPHRVGLTDRCLASFNNASSISYVWYRNGIAISGATAASYKVAETYYGNLLSCKVTATNPAGTVTATSSSYKVGVGPALVPISKPYLYRGTNRTTALAGAYEYVNRGTWSPTATSYAYQWYVGTSRISGATAYRYRVPKAYVGKTLYCVVTARRLYWTNGVYKTAGVKVVQ